MAKFLWITLTLCAVASASPVPATVSAIPTVPAVKAAAGPPAVVPVAKGAAGSPAAAPVLKAAAGAPAVVPVVKDAAGSLAAKTLGAAGGKLEGLAGLPGLKGENSVLGFDDDADWNGPTILRVFLISYPLEIIESGLEAAAQIADNLADPSITASLSKDGVVATAPLGVAAVSPNAIDLEGPVGSAKLGKSGAAPTGPLGPISVSTDGAKAKVSAARQ